MTKYKVKFIEYGVEFCSVEMTNELADILVKKLNAKGIQATFKIEIAKTF